MDEEQDDELAGTESDGNDTQAALGDLQTQYEIPGADAAYTQLAASSEDARRALRTAREQILARKYNNALPLLAVSAALGAPTRSGSFAESFGNMSQALMEPLREKDQFERERQKELMGVDAGLAGIDQRMAQSNLSLAGLRAKLAQQERNLPLEKVIDQGKKKLLTRAQARGKEFFVPPAASTNVKIGGENSFYNTLGEKQATQVSALYDAASAAPEAYQRSNRILRLLDKGTFTGTGAQYKLQVGKALQAFGINMGKTATENTEILAAEMARGTLDLVKSSGLAGSQGLTEGERKFLQQAVIGQITMEDKTLRRIAKLNKRVSRKSVEAWNKKYAGLNKDYLKQFSMAPIELPDDEDEPLSLERLPSFNQRRDDEAPLEWEQMTPSGARIRAVMPAPTNQPFDEDTAPAVDPADEPGVINFADVRSGR